jgi:hypothetical protein
MNTIRKGHVYLVRWLAPISGFDPQNLNACCSLITHGNIVLAPHGYPLLLHR